ncbi:MAG TPA: ribosome maturation factor RimP, partial [Candidatus Goldiibacteriota bacterium]|nr:ribosome maturation factor RimP [Candidatus Goldiibacteriota bacterium]
LSGGSIIRIYIDKINGRINLDECAEASRMISAALDASGSMNPDYTLEVSSPGINRPLKKPEDFIRFSGKKAKIVTKEKIGEGRVFTGVIECFTENRVLLKTQNGIIQVPFDNIKKANIDEDLFL